MPPSDMRGLTQYIADLRACRVRELEEKRVNKEMAHIRQKFKEGNLDGYSRKKYLSKLIFTYILGWPVDIGHMEAINLISSAKYSEKQIGYLALTLLMHGDSDLARLVINSIRKDLDDNNEICNCLALQAIANVGGKEMAESLAEDVHRLLISPTSQPFVKKKAALTLLRLYRKYPEVILASTWALRIVSIMDDEDLGVAVSATSLVMTLAQDNLEAFAICYQKAVGRLHKIVIQKDYSSDYLYYKVPIPWLQVKLLRLLQYYPPTDDPNLQASIQAVLQTIIDDSQETPKNVQHNNAQNAVLFEAINLAIHLDSESSIVNDASVLLGKFILSKETNVRYLGLDTMAHLAARSESLSALKKHQDTVILSLRDKDISVRRRGLDLLYSMCDTTNSKIIVGELLRYLHVADYALREELVLKIAILTEKFATEYVWYIDTILRLMAIAGDHVGDEVWYRVVQIVTNTEELQQYAAGRVFEHLRSPTCHENLVKVGAYVLGEYGHLIADEEGHSPIEQFQVVYSKSTVCSSPTRALLLTTYCKWLNLFPEIRSQLVAVLEKYTHVLDAELQQRACEYLVVSKNEELLALLCDEMPPFPERESALMNRILAKGGDASDRRTWHIGSKDINQTKDEERYQGLTTRRKTIDGAASTANGATAAVAATSVDDTMAGLAGLDLTQPSSTTNGETPRVEAVPLVTKHADINGNGASNPSAIQPPVRAKTMAIEGEDNYAHGSAKAFERLTYSPEGILYDDGQLQVGIKTEYHASQGRIALYFGNRITAAFTSFTVAIDNQQPEALGLTIPKMPASVLEGMTQVQHVIQIECKAVFTKAPLLRISYLAGSLQTLTLRIPLVLSKFIEPVELASTQFFDRWRQIGAAPLEAQRIFSFKTDSKGKADVARNRKVVGGNRFGLLNGIDPNPSNLVGAGVLHCGTVGKVGCLLRLEPNQESKLCRITIRTTNAEVSSELLEIICTPLQNPSPSRTSTA
ncbi:uncharacterized protein L969DRAFT_84535 [Mixia osmundae IAM 14324]|uniref:AP-2 complex subunit alpha n=1 Tax=Mixia osmundae (strain CBS 9802 / IAM 14324 / JCM 22182 / KY 12970) TaxID=764103 RepID=G7E569_MIXOS|nr:uncharacterized protein L969DRAFT_84535 [Mixia osmundae IAM 14324]KEI42664.1 hypothetical protein L969DRAFT_84535 [Mixia osmundae IAM 14324]GAA97979.1 hypothetical protein E5Q_04659 [Mixia osmundae IAM 14324]